MPDAQWVGNLADLLGLMQGLTEWSTVVTDGSVAFDGIATTRDHLPEEFALAGWTPEDIRSYRRLRQLPLHPLIAQGYPSIGCEPCTRPVRDGEDQRAGRWWQLDKTECGIHRGAGI